MNATTTRTGAPRRWGPVGSGLVLCLALAAASLAAAHPAPQPPSPPPYQVVHDFDGSDGAFPQAGLTLGRDGALHGTTQGYPWFNAGTAYALGAGGRTRLMHAFDGTDGQYPFAEIVQGTDGAWYTTTNAGGDHGAGTVVRIGARGATRVLHHFDPDTGDGAYPQARLVQANDGALYGTTWGGGVNGLGTIFRIAPDGTYTTVHDFGITSGDGYLPETPLIQARDGLLYGTTTAGGSTGAGTVYTLALDGTYRVLHSFTGNDAFHPSGIMQAADGLFYGLSAGGAGYPGSAYVMASDGSTTLLHAFPWSGAPEGYMPRGTLVQASNGYFYALTGQGAAFGEGSLFRMDSAGNVTVLHDMQDRTGYNGSLVQAPDGWLYGVANAGGANSYGYVFRAAAR